MIIHLRHRIYGAKVAVSSKEVAHDKSNGWEEYNPSDRKTVSIETDSSEETEDLGKEPELPSFMTEPVKPVKPVKGSIG